MGDVENNDLRLGFQPLRRVGEGERRRQSPRVSIRRTMKPTQFRTLLLLHSACRSVQVVGVASPPTESHSTPISTFDGTMIYDMSFETLRPEDSVVKRLRSTSAGKRRVLRMAWLRDKCQPITTR